MVFETAELNDCIVYGLAARLWMDDSVAIEPHPSADDVPLAVSQAFTDGIILMLEKDE